MKRRSFFLFLLFSLFVFAFWLGAWTARTEGYAHFAPEYPQLDIGSVLQKEILEEEDYKLLFRQTGMGRAGVDELWAEGRQYALFDLQERFFAEVELVCLRDLFVVQSERLVNLGNIRDLLPAVQTGDILISFNGHVFGWRNGHAAIVVDAKEGLTLEAITLGSDSRICNIEKWAEYPCFALLRLKDATVEQRAEIAEYAEENLVGISYRLISLSGKSKVAEVQPEEEGAGDVTSVAPDSLAGTHCSHLVWSAYAHFGYNLDSDGGLVVTPRDIFDSELLEVVQVYGLNPAMVEVE